MVIFRNGLVFSVIDFVFRIIQILISIILIDPGGPASGWGNRGESSPYAYSGHGGRANAYEMNVRQHRV